MKSEDKSRRSSRADRFQEIESIAQAKGYNYQPAKAWDFWVWNSDYDDYDLCLWDDSLRYDGGLNGCGIILEQTTQEALII